MAKLGHGTTFTWNSNTVGELTSIGGVSLSADSIEVTTHQSSDYYKEFLPGLIDAGEFPIEGNFKQDDTNGQIAMLTDFNARTSRACVVTFPDSIATWSFTGFLTSYEIGAADSAGVIPFSATIKISGKPTLAISASTGLTTPFFELSENAVITPTLSGNTYTYVATVLAGVTSITVTPTASAGIITVNGNTVASGEASSAIALGAAGSVTTITIVVTETNKIPKTYTIYVSRAAS